jgi:hypothetical protein
VALGNLNYPIFIFEELKMDMEMSASGQKIEMDVKNIQMYFSNTSVVLPPVHITFRRYECT